MAKLNAQDERDHAARLREKLNQGSTKPGMVLTPLPNQSGGLSVEDMLNRSAEGSVSKLILATKDAESKGSHQKISIDLIDTNPKFQPRFGLDEEHVEFLRQSFRTGSQGEPIKVRRKGSRFELLRGNHRLEAAKRSGWSEIDAIIVDMDDRQALIDASTSNAGRLNESEYERAVRMQMLLDEGVINNQAELAELYCLTPGRISVIMSMLKLPGEIRELLKKHPKLVNSKSVGPLRQLCEEHPGHINTIVEGLMRIIDGSDESSLKAWVLQSIHNQTKKTTATSIEPRIVANGQGKEMFSVRIKAKQVVVDLKGYELPENAERVIFDALNRLIAAES